MKKRIISATVLIFTMIGFMISCSKENGNAKLEDPSNLSKDKAFMTSIDIIFKENFSQRLKEQMKVYKKNWENVKSKYTTISQEILEKECAEVLANKYQKQKVPQNVAQRLPDPVDCGWRYTFALVLQQQAQFYAMVPVTQLL